VLAQAAQRTCTSLSLAHESAESDRKTVSFHLKLNALDKRSTRLTARKRCG